MKSSVSFGALALGFVALVAAAAPGIPRQPASEGAKVYIVSPANGEVVPRRFKVVFGLHGMGVAPAGIDREGTGHHHLLVNTAQPVDYSIPLDATAMHFGGGQTEVVLELEPGNHTLQLVLGDMNHVPHDPPLVSERITIRVE